MSAPDFRASAPCPASEDPQAWFVTWMELAARAENEGCTFVRFTVVIDQHPEGDTPHGCYLEGWQLQPTEQPPFSWPADA